MSHGDPGVMRDHAGVEAEDRLILRPQPAHLLKNKQDQDVMGL